MTNKSVMTFFQSIKYMSVCLPVCLSVHDYDMTDSAVIRPGTGDNKMIYSS